jgi:nitrate reductase delta subunit
MNMTIVFKALGALLGYPSSDLVEALPEIGAIVEAERRLGRKETIALRLLLADLGERDLLDLQETYVTLFDRGRATSLHLFEHIHGDSRDRGQAMVDLKAVYARAGFVLTANELPDYLPAVLEFLSQRPHAEAKGMLDDCGHIVRRIGEALQDRGSRYASVLAAVLAIAGLPGLAPPAPDQRAPKEKSVDEEWIDEPVIFGPAGGRSCGVPQPQTSVVHFTPQRESRNRGTAP